MPKRLAHDECLRQRAWSLVETSSFHFRHRSLPLRPYCDAYYQHQTLRCWSRPSLWSAGHRCASSLEEDRRRSTGLLLSRD